MSFSSQAWVFPRRNFILCLFVFFRLNFKLIITCFYRELPYFSAYQGRTEWNHLFPKHVPYTWKCFMHRCIIYIKNTWLSFGMRVSARRNVFFGEKSCFSLLSPRIYFFLFWSWTSFRVTLLILYTSFSHFLFYSLRQPMPIKKYLFVSGYLVSSRLLPIFLRLLEEKSS